MLSEAAQKLGYAPHPYPCAVSSLPYDGRPPCNDCGFCSGYGCPTNAKGTPAVTILRKGLLSGNLQLQSETRVIKLIKNGTAITGVEAIDPTGQKVTFTAGSYILSASPIEDARLLLLSDPGGPGIGNRKLRAIGVACALDAKAGRQGAPRPPSRQRRPREARRRGAGY